MKLPSDYFEIVANGARVLHALGVQLRARAEKLPEAPELWLAVRDLDGLAGRLADNTAAEWQQGFAGLLITGQDVGVLDDLAAGGNQLTAKQERAIARLRDFLQQYCDHAFEFDEPVA